MDSNKKVFQLTTEDKKNDIKYLISEIEKTHQNPYKNITKNDLKHALSKTLNCAENYMKYGIQESLALMRDAHTKVTRIGGELFPIKYEYINNNIYIIGITKSHKEFLGQKVISINSVTIQEIAKKIAKLSSQENKEVMFMDVALYLQSNNILKYIGISEKNSLNIGMENGKFEIGVGDETTFQNSIILKPLTWEKTDYICNSSYTGNNTYRFRMENDTLLFQYNACNNRGNTEDTLENFKKSLILNATKAKNIIIDLRLNSGGNTRIMADTFEKFPDNIPTYVAIGRKTLSSAVHHMIFLKLHKNAVLIGENAGQKPNRFGDRKDIILPNSKIEIQCSYKYFELLPGQDIDIIKPDISIPITVESYIKHRDPLNIWIKENL